MRHILKLSATALLILALQTSTLQAQDAKPIRADSIITDTTNIVDAILKTAHKNLGVPYKYGGKSPKTGFDCSGFVGYVYGKHNFKMPCCSKYYKNVGKKIKKKKAQPGDIILFAGRNKKTTPIGHVGIITKVTKDDILFIHSATSKNRGVVISKLSTKYYSTRFAGIRRIDYDNN